MQNLRFLALFLHTKIYYFWTSLVALLIDEKEIANSVMKQCEQNLNQRRIFVVSRHWNETPSIWNSAHLYQRKNFFLQSTCTNWYASQQYEWHIDTRVYRAWKRQGNNEIILPERPTIVVWIWDDMSPLNPQKIMIIWYNK